MKLRRAERAALICRLVGYHLFSGNTHCWRCGQPRPNLIGKLNLFLRYRRAT
jgi:hypothetical protein